MPFRTGSVGSVGSVGSPFGSLGGAYTGGMDPLAAAVLQRAMTNRQMAMSRLMAQEARDAQIRQMREAAALQYQNQRALMRQAYEQMVLEKMRQEKLADENATYERQTGAYWRRQDPLVRAVEDAKIAQAQRDMAAAQGYDLPTHESAARAMAAMARGETPGGYDAKSMHMVYGPQTAPDMVKQAVEAQSKRDVAQAMGGVQGAKLTQAAQIEFAKSFEKAKADISKAITNRTKSEDEKNAMAFEQAAIANPYLFKMAHPDGMPPDIAKTLQRIKGGGSTPQKHSSADDIVQPIRVAQGFPEAVGQFPTWGELAPDGPPTAALERLLSLDTPAAPASPFQRTPPADPTMGESDKFQVPGKFLAMGPDEPVQHEWKPLTQAMNTQNEWLLPAEVNTQAIDQKEAQRRRDELLKNLQAFYDGGYNDANYVNPAV